MRHSVRKLRVRRLLCERLRFELRRLLVPRQRILGEPAVADEDAGAARHRKLARLADIDHNAELLPHQILRFLDLVEIDLNVADLDDFLLLRRPRRRGLPPPAARGGGSSHEPFQDVVPLHPTLERAHANSELPARVAVGVHDQQLLLNRKKVRQGLEEEEGASDDREVVFGDELEAFRIRRRRDRLAERLMSQRC